MCEPSLLSSLRHPSLELFKVFYRGACLRDSSLQAGWPTYSVLPSLFTLVSCSFSFHLPRTYLLIYRLLSHRPSIILFCAIQWLGVNVFSRGAPTVLSYWGRQSVLQKGEFKWQEKLRGSLQSHYSNMGLWYDICFSFSVQVLYRVHVVQKKEMQWIVGSQLTITATQNKKQNKKKSSM